MRKITSIPRRPGAAGGFGDRSAAQPRTSADQFQHDLPVVDLSSLVLTGSIAAVKSV
jgi:hypothetical protein